MFGIDFPELIVIMILALILFGPQKLPEIGHTLGRMVRKFKEASAGVHQAIHQHTQPMAFRPDGALDQASYCSRCGHKLESDFTFCPACGARVKPEAGYPPPPSPSAPPQP